MADSSYKQVPRQACDSCRFRKIRCDRSTPCRNCRDTSLECRYTHTIRRRGPRRGVGRRLTQLKRGVSEPDGLAFQIVRFNTTCGEDQGQAQSQAEQCPSSLPPQMSELTDDVATGVHDILTPAGPWDDALSFPAADPTRSLSRYLVAHIQTFLKHMFQTMPVIDGDALLRDAICIDEVPASRYALVLSLCAATRIHLQLDIPANNVDGGPGAEIPSTPQFTGETLLSMATTALRQVDVVEVDNLDAVLSSYFIFDGYGGITKMRQASFYLNQSISLAHGLQITSESGYDGLSEKERQMRRRVFWLLFVTER